MAAGISSLIQAWKSFDLIKFQTDLDQIATELAERQDGSDISRKRLIEQSREFKKNSSEEARKEAAPVLKAFQNEIDNLTKRSKAAESAFLSVYKKIVNAQDPVPSLEYIHTIQSRLTKVSELEIENKQLKDTIEENNREFAEIRNQEITIKNLRDRIKENDEKIDSRVADRIRDRERELTKLFMEKERQLHEDKVETLRKLGDIEKKYSSLQIAYESTQAELFDLRSRNEEAQGAKSSELDLVMGDLDLANQNLAAAEKEIETLQSTVLDLRNSQSPKNKEKFEEVLDRLTKSSLEAELSTKEKELTQLVNENHRLSQQVTLVNDKLEVNRVNYSNNLGKLQEEIDKLKDQLQRCSDYEDTKRELNIMKSIEFQESADESEDAKPLEILLLEKNRSQQNELISLRNQHLQLQERNSKLEQEHRESLQTVADQKDLIGQLEKDLLTVNAKSSLFRTEADGASVKTSSPGFSTEQEFLAEVVTQNTSDDSLLSIISNQRERLRIQNHELEAECQRYQQKVFLLQNDIDRYRTDNVKLFEKIRFLQSYQNKDSKNIEGVSASYSNQYEDRLDPFTSFNQKERRRKYGSLSPFEKMTFNIGQMVMSNKSARTFVFVYLIILHILVFLVLYRFSMGTAAVRDLSETCHEKQELADHMAQFHPKGPN